MASSERSRSDLLTVEDEHFRFINEKGVDDISLEFFYKPHTITLLTVSVIGLLYTAFTRNDAIQENNIWRGLCCVVFFFLVISVLAFPNGPFTRPHPALWRIVFGMSVFYFMLLVFILFQNRKDVRKMINWVYPDLEGVSIEEKEYAVNCSHINPARLWSHLDCFAAAHFLGWALKALLIRHYGILWTISIMWEITEMAFQHLLPNFAECWWDAWLLDVLICNGLGIWVGMEICKKLEMRNYHWESIKDIHSTTGKIRRAVLQFTPASWTHVRWLDPNSSYMRVVAVCIIITVWQLSELNTFFLKHILDIPSHHTINVWRLVLVSLVSAPSIRQYYVYVTDTRCTRMGVQSWMFCAITFTEAIICFKFGLDIFKKTEVLWILFWLSVQMIGSMLCVYLCALWAQNWKWKVNLAPVTCDKTLHEGFYMSDKEIKQNGKTSPDDFESSKSDKIHLNGSVQNGVPNGYNLRKRQKVYTNGHL